MGICQKDPARIPSLSLEFPKPKPQHLKPQTPIYVGMTLQATTTTTLTTMTISITNTTITTVTTMTSFYRHLLWQLQSGDEKAYDTGLSLGMLLKDERNGIVESKMDNEMGFRVEMLFANA